MISRRKGPLTVLCLAPTGEAETRKTQQLHRPGRGLRNADLQDGRRSVAFDIGTRLLVETRCNRKVDNVQARFSGRANGDIAVTVDIRLKTPNRGPPRIQFNSFAKPSANVRSLRGADGRSRRKAVIPDKVRQLRYGRPRIIVSDALSPADESFPRQLGELRDGPRKLAT
jgi:hypothetical protein